MIVVALFLFYFLFPALIVKLCKKIPVINKIGVVCVSYIVGLLVGNLGVFPRMTPTFRDLLSGKMFIPQNEAIQMFEEGIITNGDLIRNQIAFTQDIITTIVIPLSIPLLLFSLDIRNSIKTLKKGLLSLCVAIFSLIIAIVIGNWIFKDSISESWKIAGTMVGLYTGGTPNLAALAKALDVQPTTFILTHTYDLIISSLLIFFFITSAQSLFNKILPRFKATTYKIDQKIEVSEESAMFGRDMFNRKKLFPLLGALCISALIFAIGGGLSLCVNPDNQMAVAILTITTLGILVSLSPRINRIEKTFDLGMYLIFVFSLTVSSMADFHDIFSFEHLNLLLYVAIAVFGSMAIHVLLSYIFKIDTDTTIVTITALSCSPPFVPMIAGALKNRNIIVMGITIGIIGYAIGNYLGIGIAYLLK